VSQDPIAGIERSRLRPLMTVVERLAFVSCWTGCERGGPLGKRRDDEVP
jgi:hypothetical protein